MDELRIAVAPVVVAGDSPGYQVQVFVNGLEVTAQHGVGLDPFDVLVPTNRLEAGPTPTRVAIGRCGCGEYGCDPFDVVIARSAGQVEWTWPIRDPLGRPATFDAAAYDAELARVAADHLWEPPSRWVGRLLLSSLSPGDLPAGCRVDFVQQREREPGIFRVVLRVDEDYQVMLAVPFDADDPEGVAQAARHLLVEVPPQRWTARRAAIGKRRGVPSIAGPGWSDGPFW